MREDLKFIEYISNFDLQVKENRLKFLHTNRVVKNCYDLAINIDLQKKEVELAKKCGLLHDIGRFNQFEKYNTFIDKDSCDHGNLGYEVLIENELINEFENRKCEKQAILNSVKYHNKLEIPDNLDSLSNLMLKIVRDADKLDIFYLVINKEIIIDAKDEDISDYAFNTILNNKCINKEIRKTNKDRMLTWISFIYDLNYEESLKIIKNNNYVEKIIDMYRDNNKNANEKLDIIKKHVIEYINNSLQKENEKKKVRR